MKLQRLDAPTSPTAASDWYRHALRLLEAGGQGLVLCPFANRTMSPASVAGLVKNVCRLRDLLGYPTPVYVGAVDVAHDTHEPATRGGFPGFRREVAHDWETYQYALAYELQDTPIDGYAVAISGQLRHLFDVTEPERDEKDRLGAGTGSNRYRDVFHAIDCGDPRHKPLVVTDLETDRPEPDGWRVTLLEELAHDPRITHILPE